MTNLKIPRGFSEKYILNPAFWNFVAIAQCCLTLVAILTIDDMEDDASDMLRFSLKY